ncbi:MAG: hypothetical protein AAFO69_19870, partial [Bacteroidota bacterium]
MKGLYFNYKAYLLISLVFLIQCSSPRVKPASQEAFEQLKATYLSKLLAIDQRMDSLVAGKGYQSNLAAARQLFKQVEPVMAYVHNSDFQSLNRPNILGVKEEDQTDIKVFPSLGFQVLEE